jgi:hypothetical protein
MVALESRQLVDVQVHDDDVAQPPWRERRD